MDGIPGIPIRSFKSRMYRVYLKVIMMMAIHWNERKKVMKERVVKIQLISETTEENTKYYTILLVVGCWLLVNQGQQSTTTTN